MALERTERGRESEEGSGEGGDSGKVVNGAGRGRGRAGRKMTQKKKAEPVRARLGLGVGGVLCFQVDEEVLHVRR